MYVFIDGYKLCTDARYMTLVRARHYGTVGMSVDITH